MIFDFNDHNYIPFDRHFYVSENNIKSHFLTLGTASYVSGIKFDLARPQKSHILIGRFCPISSLILFVVGQNHSYKNVVSTYSFEDEATMRKFAANLGINSSAHSPQLNSQSNNHYQIIIGHDVWIGRNVTMRSGVKIGNGAIIGTSAVVTKDVPPYAIVAGNPAKIIKYRFDKETIKKFMAVKWWNWDVKKILANIPIMKNAEKFLSEHYKPELEYIPPAQIGGGAQIEQLRAEGRKIFSFVGDFRAFKPIWKRVIKGFLKSDLKNAVMLFWLGENATQKDFIDAKIFAESIGVNDGKIIFFLPPNAGKIFEPYLLRNSTHFITTREMVTLDCLDFLYDTDIKIISALDDNIFEGEPAVNWKEIYS